MRNNIISSVDLVKANEGKKHVSTGVYNQSGELITILYT